MKTFIICVIVLILLTTGPLLLNHLYLLWKSRQLAREKYAAVKPLLEKLVNRQSISLNEVQDLAVNPSLRISIFRILTTYERMDLFPDEQLFKAQGAESFMVNWLEYPTELSMAPNEIELMESVLHGGETDLEYFVFRFRMQPPHRASARGWMMGVTGPYAALAPAYDVPLRVFSRFRRVGSETAAGEVQWVHENINPVTD